MIDSEDHPRMKRAHEQLLARLGKLLGDGTKPLTTGLLHDMMETVKYHRAECRREHNIDFPVLVALVVPERGIVEFKRADLDLPSIRESIVNFVRFNPGVTMPQVAAAFRAAYPHLKPDDVLQGQDNAQQADVRQAERSERIVAEAEQIIKEEDGGGTKH